MVEENGIIDAVHEAYASGSVTCLAGAGMRIAARAECTLATAISVKHAAQRWRPGSPRMTKHWHNVAQIPRLV